MVEELNDDGDQDDDEIIDEPLDIDSWTCDNCGTTITGPPPQMDNLRRTHKMSNKCLRKTPQSGGGDEWNGIRTRSQRAAAQHTTTLPVVPVAPASPIPVAANPPAPINAPIIIDDDTPDADVDTEEVVARRGAFTIYRRDVDLVTKGHQLNDTSVNAILRDAQRLHPGTWLVSSQALSIKAISTSISKAISAGVTRILLPCARRNHWIMITADIRNHTLCIFDSAPGIIRPIDYEIVVHALEHVTKSKWDLRSPSCPLQPTGSIDCGAYTIAAGIRAMNGSDMNAPITGNLRASVAKALIDGTGYLEGIEGCQQGTASARQQTRNPRPTVFVVRDFNKGTPSPQGAPITQGPVTGLHALLWGSPTLPTNQDFKTGISDAQRATHVRMIRLLQAHIAMKPERLDMPLHLNLIASTSEHHRLSRCSAVTSLRNLQSAIAALLRLDQYCGEYPLDLRNNATIKDCIRLWSKRASAEAARRRPFLSTLQLRTALTRTLDPELRMLLLLTWANAARPSNTIMLGKEDLDTSEWKTFWRTAKTVVKRQPYWTPTTLGPYEEEVKTYHNSIPDGPLFPNLSANSRTIINSLKALRALLPKGFDLRTLRRGALIALGQAGMPDSQLIVLSGHTTTQSLHRYLQWGRYRSELAEMRASLLHLWD